MSLTVLNVAYPFAAVAPDSVGGAEQVLARLDGALSAAGHRSLVLACRGSRVRGTLHDYDVPAVALTEPLRAAVRARVRPALARLLSDEEVDVVHMHGVDFHHYLPPAGVATLVTLHLPLGWYASEALEPGRPDTHLHCVSPSQARTSRGVKFAVSPVPNGVDLDEFRPRPRQGFALALGRICPEKGFHLALDAAALADVTLVLAGSVFRYPEHERYFAAEIAPRLDQRRRCIGPVSGARKRRLLGAARCVLVPSVVEETSSLVAREALASGTPVVAFRRGALAEVVEHGRTGFLVDTVEDMASAIRACDAIDGAECRRAAEARFDARAMCASYLSLYARLAARQAPLREAVGA